MRKHIAAAAVLAALTIPPNSHAFTFFLEGGAFFGPGDKGIHPFKTGALNNFIPTGPLSGFIPFFNNGPALPNVREAEQVGGIVDGRVSSGQLINENLDTSFVINTNDPKNGFVSMFVTGVNGGELEGEEHFQPDEKGNLTLRVDVVFDPGIPELAVPLQVNPTTGARRVPFSLKTQMGESGGNDMAGPFPSGRMIFGNLGDYDQDGFVDGLFVLSESSPLNLIVAEGDPVGFTRGFTSDLPIAPIDAAFATAGSILANFPEPVIETMVTGQFALTQEYVYNIDDRLYAATENLLRVDDKLCQSAGAPSTKLTLKRARLDLLGSRESFFGALSAIDARKLDEAQSLMQQAFGKVGSAFEQIGTVRNCASGA